MTLATDVAVIAHPRRGRVQSRLEALERRLAPVPEIVVVDGHPLPELDDSPVEQIVSAFLDAIWLAHGRNPHWGTGKSGDPGLCPACLAALAEAQRYAYRGAEFMPWPDPFARAFADDVPWRTEMKRWADRPGVRFERAAWLSDRERRRTETVFTDPAAIPPWVIIDALRD